MNRNIFPFDIDVASINLDTFLRKEVIEITFKLGMKSVSEFKGNGYFWINEKKKKLYEIFVLLYTHLARCSKFIYGRIWF